MGKASRAIILRGEDILVMYRHKEGAEYYTLVGGRLKEGETAEQGLIREVKEETGLDISAARLVFIEKHPEPYNEQYIYLCEASNHDEVAIQSTSEEAMLNKLKFNTHEPLWTHINLFSRLHFRTPQLQTAITKAIAEGFPSEPLYI
jgi:ADP-ribose pyrophosphatase YjhB (NUDIX family)